MTTRNYVNQIGRGLAIMLTAALLGCSSGSQPQDTNKPSFLLRATAPAAEQPGNAPVQAKSPLKLRVKPQLTPEVRQFLGGFSAPQLPANPAAEKRPSVLLPTGFTGDWAYTSGDQGYLSSHNVSFPGPPFGGADMQPTGPDYPDNISWIIYRIDDIVGQDPGMLTISMGLTVPGTMVGVAPYNWAYGSNGQWEPLYFDDPNNTGGQIQIQLFGFPGEDFTNANDDLAFMIFCLHPGSTNVSTIQLEEGGGVNPNYDEVEPNDGDTQANTLPAFNFGGFTGNVGEGGAYDGTPWDVFTFSATTGDTVDFTVTYDPASDHQDQDGDPQTLDSGMAIAIVDQEFWNSGGGLALAVPGIGGIAQLSHTLDGSEILPLYFIVLNPYAVTPVPATDYSMSATGPGGGSYDEVEDNDDPGFPNALPAFDFTGFSGNVGFGGPHDDLIDFFSCNASIGDTVSFTVTYDPAADYNPGDFSGTLIGIVDQEWVDTLGASGLIITDEGSGGVAQVSHTFAPGDDAPFYFAIQNDNSPDAGPATDYSLDATGP